jgi:biotin operon repressor
MGKTVSATEAGPDRKTLVSIQIEKEFDVLEKRWDQRVYVKLYVAARTSGLLARIPDRDWKTLCTLATFMDEDGQCFPSQGALAKALGVNRSTVNRRIQALAQFRFEGKAILLVERQYKKTRKNGGLQFATNRYTILPATHMRIFDGKGKRER